MVERIDIEFIKKQFLEKGLTPLFTEYLNNAQKLPFRCFCGREDSTKWTHFINAKDFGCWFCKHNIKGTEIEKTNKLRYLLEQKQVSPVEPLIFPKGDSYFPVVCACGETFNTKVRYLWNVKSGERYKCKKCLSNNLTCNFDKIKQEFRRKGATPLFIEKDYQNKSSLLCFKCSCGKEDVITFSNLKQTKSLVCSDCRIQRKLLSLEEVKQRFLDKGLIPLFESYTSGKELLPCKTKCCGELKYVSLANLPNKNKTLSGKCIKCQSNSRRLPFSKIKEEFEVKRGLQVLSSEEDYKNIASKLKLQCICGTEIYRSYANTVLTGSSGLCEQCQFKITRPRGKKHGMFNPNLTDSDRKYNDTQYVTWANQTKKLYNSVCFIKKTKEEKIVVHHLNGRHWYKRDRLYILNAVPLSESLHKEFHSLYGYGKNTREQFQEWLREKEITFDPVKILRESSFYVRRLLLFLDLKNICKQEKIQIVNTETPYLFLLQSGGSCKPVYLMDFKNSRREHLIVLKEKHPDLLILSPLEILLPEKRNLLQQAILNYLHPLNSEGFPLEAEVKEIQRELNCNFIQSNSILPPVPKSKGFGLFVKDELLATISLSRKGNWQYLSNFVVKQGISAKEAFVKIFEFFILKTKFKKIYYIQDRRFPLQSEIHSYFKILKIGRPRNYYTKNSLRIKEGEFFKNMNLREKLKRYDPSLSTHENLVLNGYHRIYDAGTIISIWKREAF